jgi:zinc/manganese transport system substrate-binding protein
MDRSVIRWTAAAAALMLGLGLGIARAEPLEVVASFSILGDMVHRVGGDRTHVVTIVGPGADTHVYEPTPADAKALAAARLLVVNGLGLEGWMSRLQNSAGFRGKVVVASAGVEPRGMKEDEDDKSRTIADPHAWQSLANGRIYVGNIRDALIAADPEGRPTYEANAARFLEDIDATEAEVKAAIAKIPPARRKIITSHDAFGYFGAAYGFSFIAPEGVSTETEASAKDVARIIRQIKAEKIPAVFMENITSHRLLDQIARETGAAIGGTLYSDALSKADGPAATYLDMFRHNIGTLARALTS